MADNKKSFLLYCDLIHTVEKMPDDKAGQLFKHILEYVNDKNPITEDLIIQLTFEPIKQQLKRDLVKYDQIREKRSKAGLASADKRQHVLTHVESVQQEPTNPTVNDNVTVNVIDSVKDNVSDKEEKVFNSNKKISDFKKSVHPSYRYIKDFYLIFHLEKTRSEYYFESKDGQKINSLIKKLLFKIKEKNPAIKKESEPEEINKAFKYFIESIQDQWILNNLSLTILDSKFNEIINQILNPLKNGKQTVKDFNDNASRQVLADIANGKF